jgi:ubiquinone/menaquinone biosynthesis C-methylase UbiE
MSLIKSSREISRHTFERHADFYDNSKIINSYLDKWDQEILKMNLPCPLLDMGCGPGRLLGKLLQSGDGDIHGVDITLAGLRLAEKKVSSTGGLYTLTEASLEELPYKDNSFSTLLMTGVFHHLEKPKPVLAEAARVLANSGILLIADPYFPPLMRQFINIMLSIYPVTGDRRFYSEANIEKLAKKHGFVKKSVYDIPLAYILVFEKCYS